MHVCLFVCLAVNDHIHAFLDTHIRMCACVCVNVRASAAANKYFEQFVFCRCQEQQEYLNWLI